MCIRDRGYGLTETSPVLTAERPWAVSPGSVGTPMNSVKIRIEEKDENGIGEIVAQGPNVMQGYYNQPEETAKAIVDGWFYTGDLGKIDSKDVYKRQTQHNILHGNSGSLVGSRRFTVLSGRKYGIFLVYISGPPGRRLQRHTCRPPGVQ